jgi:hypothetical protein
MLAKHALSQLSYGPMSRSGQPVFALSGYDAAAFATIGLPSRSWRCLRRLVGLGRLELPTSRLSSARSNQLSYKPLTLPSIRNRDMLARNRLTPMHRTALSPWRVFVREERET